MKISTSYIKTILSLCAISSLANAMEIKNMLATQIAKYNMTNVKDALLGVPTEEIHTSITQSSVLTPKKKKIKLYHTQKQLHVLKKDGDLLVENQHMDKLLRKLKNNKDDLLQFLNDGGYIQIKENGDGTLSLEAQQRLLGGGIFGAQVGFYTGKFLIHLLAQTAIVGISIGANILVPGSGIPLGIALEKTLAVPVEVVSNTVGLGCGLVGAATTGPV